MTALELVSIDGPHTREIDDALSIEGLPGGACRLGIHIADPAAFVEPRSDLDAEALARSLTHYMPDVRLPMLPAAISEQAASLTVDEERPALSFLVDLDEQGLALVKLFALGRGTFFSNRASRSTGRDVYVVESEVRFGYAHVDLSGFSPGTTFYICGKPVGRVWPIRVPAGAGEVTVDALTSVRLEWTLVRARPTAACPGGWTVAGVSPVEGSEITSEITWVF